MHGEVGLLVEKGQFKFLGKEPFRERRSRFPGFGHGSLLQLVAGGFDDFQLDAPVRKGRPTLGGNHV
jgi:hypothetical protein